MLALINTFFKVVKLQVCFNYYVIIVTYVLINAIKRLPP